ncbi:hypothetical protein L1887_15553 [Cichorium endivia]|nr:hypothetical protein L1887_15553 [Cichorium endivia]
MKNIHERTDSSKNSYTTSSNSPDRIHGSTSSNCPEAHSSNHKFPKASLWSGILGSAFSVFDSQKKESSSRSHGWTATVKRVMNGGSMRRIQERVLGYKTNVSNSISDIWLLGVCYKI